MSLPFLDPVKRLAKRIQSDWGLEPATALAAAKLITWCAHYGITIRIVSGRRSTQKQAELYYTRRGVAPGVPVARPGTSTHEKGIAFDAAWDYGWWRAVSYLATQAGLKWGGWSDPVHFSRR